MIFGKSRAEKDLDKIVEKVGVACEQFTQAVSSFTTTTSKLGATITEIDKFLASIEEKLKGINEKLDAYNKKVDKMKPVGLDDVVSELKDVKSILVSIDDGIRDIANRQSFDATGLFTNIQYTLDRIENGIDSLEREIRYSRGY